MLSFEINNILQACTRYKSMEGPIHINEDGMQYHISHLPLLSKDSQRCVVASSTGYGYILCIE